MHVAKVSKKYVTKDGSSRESVAYLLRRTYRDGARVKHETLANLTALPEATLEAVRISLTGQALVVPGAGLEVTRSLPHGHVAAIHAQAKALGLPALLGPAGRHRDLALALIIARVARPGSKLATTRWWADTTLAEDLGVEGASTPEWAQPFRFDELLARVRLRLNDGQPGPVGSLQVRGLELDLSTRRIHLPDPA